MFDIKCLANCIRALAVSLFFVILTTNLAVAETKTGNNNAVSAAGSNATVNAGSMTNKNPSLATLISQGMKVYYIGTRSGVDGWLLLNAEGQTQFAYTFQGSKDLLIGVMFDDTGAGLTELQFDKFMNEHPDVLQTVNNHIKSEMAASGLPQAAGLGPGGVNSPFSTKGVSPGTLSPGDRLIHDFSGAAGVNIGNASAPQLMMIMDPNCPHCQASWRLIRDVVFKNTIQVRLIPVAKTDGDSERAAAMLLLQGNALQAWDKYVSGDKSQLAGTPDQSDIAAIRANHALVDSWNIDATPYFFYRDKNGQVKIVKGEIKNLDAIVSDLVP